MANEDTQTTVANLDIQILNAERAETTTFKLDNPKQNLTREMVSAAMQPALANGWLLTSKGSVAMYLGDVTYNTSIKTKLGGEDFYVTPTSFNETYNDNEMKTLTVNVSGATIQGYNLTNFDVDNFVHTPDCTILNNGLTFKFEGMPMTSENPITFKIQLVIQGVIIEVPVTLTYQG